MRGKRSIGRRGFLTRAAAVAGAPFLISATTGWAQTPAKPSRMVVNASGGAMGQAVTDSYVKVFQERFGIPVTLTSPPDLGKLKAMVDSGNVEWDVTEIS